MTPIPQQCLHIEVDGDMLMLQAGYILTVCLPGSNLIQSIQAQRADIQNSIITPTAFASVAKLADTLCRVTTMTSNAISNRLQEVSLEPSSSDPSPSSNSLKDSIEELTRRGKVLNDYLTRIHELENTALQVSFELLFPTQYANIYLSPNHMLLPHMSKGQLT